MDLTPSISPATVKRVLLALEAAANRDEPTFIVVGFGVKPSVVRRAKALIEEKFISPTKAHIEGIAE